MLTAAANNSSGGYYKQMKDEYILDPIVPFRSQKYLTVLLLNATSIATSTTNSNDNNLSSSSGVLCVYKLRNYEKKHRLTSSSTSSNPNSRWAFTSSRSSDELHRWRHSLERRGKYEEEASCSSFSALEPPLVKKLKHNENSAAACFDRNRTTVKLKKVIDLGCESLKNSLLQTCFLNSLTTDSAKEVDGYI